MFQLFGLLEILEDHMLQHLNCNPTAPNPKPSKPCSQSLREDMESSLVPSQKYRKQAVDWRRRTLGWLVGWFKDTSVSSLGGERRDEWEP